MYQIRDKKENVIIARFVTEEDANAFLRTSRDEDRERYILVNSGEKETRKDKE